MNYKEAIAYLTGIPAFIPRKVKPGEELFNLDNITALLDRLGRPQDSLRFIHVAGTNGKGSFSAYLESILRAAGYRTGLYTSPAIERFTERIRTDGREITPDALARLTEKVRSAAGDMKRRGEGTPSEFEAVCAIALLYFAECGCDAVVLETGLGGRLDATNVISAPLLAVIMTISYDHTEVLGDTLAKIAGEKAGIIKRGSQVLLYPQQPESEEVFERVCSEKGVPLYHALLPADADSFSLSGQTFHLRVPENISKTTGEIRDLRTSLLGPYQVSNAAMAALAALLLRNRGLIITEEAIRAGIAGAKWPGRFELMHKNPFLIVDGSHNPEGAETLARGLRRYFPGKKITFITGVLADKKYDRMMASVAPLAERFYTVEPDSPRALSASDLAAYLRSSGSEAEAAESLRDALTRAFASAGTDGVICAFGSLYYIGEIRRLITSAEPA